MQPIPIWLDARTSPTPSIRKACGELGIEVFWDGLQGTHALIDSKKAQKVAVETPGIIVIEGKDWTIIPLENLIAARTNQPGSNYALVRSKEEAIAARGVLQVGVDGIVIHTTSETQLREIHAAVAEIGKSAPTGAPTTNLAWGEITRIKALALGKRVCLDMTTHFGPNEGLFVGSTSKSLALVISENLENDFVNTRPFRVNAGATHSYVLAADGKTAYLSESVAGQQFSAANQDGISGLMTLGRAKFELRPMVLLEWHNKDGSVGKGVYQQAETVRIQTKTGPVAVTALKLGDEIRVLNFTGARHFGMAINEFLEER